MSPFSIFAPYIERKIQPRIVIKNSAPYIVYKEKGDKRLLFTFLITM